ncbi:sulfatase [Blastopirellula sp. JC732]|uniref:Sulfatase n=1 Tax=Blastopirellula sediminis TaxID=2894196 RepID=A0A9X1MII8_9BACT|nr:sulfatase [Blastopirellula sediminis]MCC9609501.1 sulfatase [Blastopirellula sediminis]MCC9627723.1 sulfatase [Blastopirellula sediminis]
MPRLNLVLAALLAAVCFASAAVAQEKRPNVLFIAVDDLRTELGCYGDDWIHSPNIDRLAASGTVFTRAYCQQAVCSPSRTSLMTGLRPDSTRVYDLVTHFRKNIPDVVTLGQHFKQNGYYSVSMGKIYHGGYDDLPTWSEPARKPKGGNGYVLPENKVLLNEKRVAAKAKGLKGTALSRAVRGPATEMADVPDNAYTDGAIAELAVKSLRELSKRDEPFFLAVGFVKPHLPFNAPKKYWDMYDPAKIELAANPFPPKNVTPYSLTTWGEMRVYEGIPKKGDLTEDQARQLKHGYYASVSFTDANVGKLLDELDKLKLTDDTIVVLWGDHGWKLGEHNCWCKHTNFENDANAPLIIRAPGQKSPGAKSEALVEFVDIYPTLCELADLSLPERLEGTSAAPLLDTPDAKWKSAAFSQYPRGNIMGYTMKTDQYRFTAWKNKKTGEVVATELYDHQVDPAENENVAGEAENAQLVAKLQERLDAGWKDAKPK